MKFKSGLTHPSNMLQEHIDSLSKDEILECLELVATKFDYNRNWLIHIERRFEAEQYIKTLEGRKGDRHVQEAKRWLQESICRIYPEESSAFTSVGGP